MLENLIDKILNREKSDVDEFADTIEYKQELYKFLQKKDILGKVPDKTEKDVFSWRIGSYGKLLTENIVSWWIREVLDKPKNMYSLQGVNNDNRFFMQYKMYAKLKNLSIPFGIGRLSETPKESMNNNKFC